jgi:flagellin
MNINVYGALASANSSLAQTQLTLASGKKVNSVRDDQAGYMIARRAETSTRVNNAASGNDADLMGMLNVMIASLQDMEADMIREQELSMAYNAGSTVLSIDELTAIEIEAATLANQWNDDQLAIAFTYNGYLLSDGGMDFSTVQIGEGATNTGGAASNTFVGANASTPRVWAELWDASAIDRATDVSGGGFAQGTVAFDAGAIELALQDIRTELARLAGWQNQLQEQINSNNANASSTDALRSRWEDTDNAAATIAATKGQILSQIATAQLAAANQAKTYQLGLF